MQRSAAGASSKWPRAPPPVQLLHNCTLSYDNGVQRASLAGLMTEKKRDAPESRKPPLGARPDAYRLAITAADGRLLQPPHVAGLNGR